MPVLFCDLETTGLLANHHTVIEIAMIATNDSFGEIARFKRVIHLPYAAGILDGTLRAKNYSIVPVVVDMHTKNGLWTESIYSTQSHVSADREARDWLANTFGQDLGERKGPQLAGNTINFDRGFLQACFPLMHDCLSYRNIDLTTMNQMAQRFSPSLYLRRPGQDQDSVHRAMPDVEHSVSLAKYYAKHMMGV